MFVLSSRGTVSTLLRIVRTIAGLRGGRCRVRGPAGEEIVRTYDGSGRLVEEQVSERSGAPVSEVRRFDRSERRVETTFHGPSGSTVLTRYDGMGQILSEEHRDGGGALVKRLEFTYVGNEAVIRVVDAQGVVRDIQRSPRHGV